MNVNRLHTEYKRLQTSCVKLERVQGRFTRMLPGLSGDLQGEVGQARTLFLGGQEAEVILKRSIKSR